MQKIALPLVLCNDTEIEPYQAAKQRIEDDFSTQGLEVGAFFFQVDRSLLPENVNRSVNNSGRVCTMATQRSFVPNLALKDAGGLEQLLRVLKVTRALRNRRAGLKLDLHLGVCANDSNGTSRIARKREELFQQMVQSLGEATDAARALDLGLLIESTPPLTLEEKEGRPEATFYAFVTLADLEELEHAVGRSNFGITFDAAALGSMRAAEQLDPKMLRLAARINGFRTWNELVTSYGSINHWITAAKEYHLSNATGISFHTLNQFLREKYGVMGTIEGALSRDEIGRVLRAASEKEAVCCVEVELKLEQLTYNEPRQFLKWAFE